ncbi:MAG: hypothetical protein KDJ65_40510, partial [Anaerolineae bacterium]|nr:hypothetical protein [Anaerolineae bacterium]
YQAANSFADIKIPNRLTIVIQQSGEKFNKNFGDDSEPTQYRGVLGENLPQSGRGYICTGVKRSFNKSIEQRPTVFSCGAR